MRSSPKRRKPTPSPLPVWDTQDAKARFSELVSKASEADQVIRRSGREVAVIVSKERYEALTRHSKDLLDFFRSAPCQDVELNLDRSRDLPREIEL